MRQGVSLQCGNWRAGHWLRGWAGVGCAVALAASVIVALAVASGAQESGSPTVAMPLHERIDRLIEAQLGAICKGRIGYRQLRQPIVSFSAGSGSTWRESSRLPTLLKRFSTTPPLTRGPG